MSSVLCHIDLLQRGAIAASARLIDARTSAAWAFTRSVASAGSDADTVPGESVSTLARWIVQQLAATSAEPDLTLCLDVDQATCGWVTASGSDDRAIKSAVRDAQAGEREDAGQTTPANWLKVGEANADLSVQALQAPELQQKRKGVKINGKAAGPSARAAVAARERLAIVALPDLAARTLIDELDRVDQPVARIMTLWHALAEAWDPSRSDVAAVLKASSSARIVADDISATATVLLDPRGRILWTWQQGGRMICAGSLRLAIVSLASDSHDNADKSARGQPPLLEVTASEIARLTADWLAWAAQLGVGPSVITVIGQQDLAAPGLCERFSSASPLMAVSLAIGSSWPGSLVTANVEASPIEATLRRVIEGNTKAAASAQQVDPRTGLVELASRPGKASRMVYRWSAAAAFAAAMVLAALCARVVMEGNATAAARTQAVADRAELLKSLVPVAPKIMTEQRQANYIQTLLTERERQRTAIVPEKPIVPELGRFLAAAAVQPNLTLRRVAASSTTGFRAELNVPDAMTGGHLREKLDTIPPATPEFVTWSTSDSRIGDVFSVTASGVWTGKPAAVVNSDAAKPAAKAGSTGKPVDESDKPSDAKAEVKPETKLEVKGEVNPQVKAETKLAPKVEAKQPIKRQINPTTQPVRQPAANPTQPDPTQAPQSAQPGQPFATPPTEDPMEPMPIKPIESDMFSSEKFNEGNEFAGLSAVAVSIAAAAARELAASPVTRFAIGPLSGTVKTLQSRGSR